jgi:hypothetical protein
MALVPVTGQVETDPAGTRGNVTIDHHPEVDRPAGLDVPGR